MNLLESSSFLFVFHTPLLLCFFFFLSYPLTLFSDVPLQNLRLQSSPFFLFYLTLVLFFPLALSTLLLPIYSYVIRLEKVSSQPPPWRGDGVFLAHVSHACSWVFEEVGPPLLQDVASSSRDDKKEKQTNKQTKKPSSTKGSTIMPLFSRVHECKACEHRNEMRVWIMSVTKWTLPKNKKDP